MDPAPRRPAELRAATSWIIPFGVTTRDNAKATVYGTSSLSQTFHDSLDDEICSGRANKSIKLSTFCFSTLILIMVKTFQMENIYFYDRYIFRISVMYLLSIFLLINSI